MKYVIAVGNAFDGIRLIGPFKDAQSANEYAEMFIHSDTWVVMRLDKPLNE
jgi:hypothetical protein